MSSSVGFVLKPSSECLKRLSAPVLTQGEALVKGAVCQNSLSSC